MSVRQIFDTNGKISAQFLPAPIPFKETTLEIAPESQDATRTLSPSSTGGPVVWPFYNGQDYIPTVIGETYSIQGTLQLSSVKVDAQTYPIDVWVGPSDLVDTGVLTCFILNGLPSTATTTAPYIVPFSAIFTPTTTQTLVWCDANATINAGNSTTITLRNVYLTRLS